jgi:hypothetical protein
VRTGGVDPLGDGRSDRRCDVLRVLAAEQPVLAGVRVETADRDPGSVEEPAERDG